MDEAINIVEICIHRARNIHNICIYHDQDVYANIFFIDKPENKISTSVINGGGQNPVFNETLRLAIQTAESSLKFEVWMLSRIKNYLEDQMLGFTMLPLSDIISYNGKPAREFELSSSEVFHSPAGFIELSFKSNIETTIKMTKSKGALGTDVATSSDICLELDKVEFPDEVMENEHERMASEYLSHPCDDRENDDVIKSQVLPMNDSASCLDASSTDSDARRIVEEEIVDMYMKSMQEFSDALAKMKFRIDEEECRSKRESKETRVFYGSRAFF